MTPLDALDKPEPITVGDGIVIPAWPAEMHHEAIAWIYCSPEPAVENLLERLDTQHSRAFKVWQHFQFSDVLWNFCGSTHSIEPPQANDHARMAAKRMDKSLKVIEDYRDTCRHRLDIETTRSTARKEYEKQLMNEATAELLKEDTKQTTEMDVT